MKIQIPKPNCRTVLKYSFVILALLGWALNYLQSREWIAFRCEVNKKIVARLVSQTTCGTLNETWQDSLSYAELRASVSANNEAARNEIDGN